MYRDVPSIPRSGCHCGAQRIVEEPTAAALAYGLHVSDGFVDAMRNDGDNRLPGRS
jgi:hypothetical protein